MKRNDGYVFQRASTGKWYVRLTHTDPATGKRKEPVMIARDEDHARELLAQLVAGLE